MLRRLAPAAAAAVAWLVLSTAPAGASVGGLVARGSTPVTGLGPGERIASLAADEPARQLVAAMSTGRTVRRFAADGSQLGEFATQPSDPDAQGLGAVDVAVGPAGEIALSRQATHEIERYAPDGRLLGRIQLDAAPDGVDYDTAGRLLVHAGHQVQTLSASGAVESAVGVGLGGTISAAWVVGDGRLWQLGGGRVTALVGSSGTLWLPGRFGRLTDAAAVAPEGGVWALDGRLQYFDRLGRARTSCPLDGRNGTPDRLARLGRTLHVSNGIALQRFEMTRKAPGICARQALRIVRARVLGGGRLRVTVTRRARLRIIALREDRGHLLPVGDPRPLALRRGANTVRVRGLARGRHRLQLTASARGADAGYPLLSFRR